MSKLKPYNTYQPVQYDYVAQLPEGWKLLPNIAIFQERIERGHENEELLSVTIGRGVIKQSELDKKDSSTLDKSKYLLVYPNDLVYSMRFRQGASGYSIYKGIVSPACTVLKPRKGIEINPRFFYYMFRTGFYKNYVERFAYGIADGQIPLRYVDFKRMYSIVPPLETQNDIVTYLDNKTLLIEKFIIAKKSILQNQQDLKQAIIDKYLTGFKTSSLKLKYSCDEIFLGLTSKVEYTDDKNIGVPLVTATNIKDGVLDLSEANNISEKQHKKLTKYRKAKKNDVLLSKSGSIGTPAIVDTEAEFSIYESIFCLRPKTKILDFKYLYYVLQSGIVKTQIKDFLVGMGVHHLNMSDVKNIKFPIPDIGTQTDLIYKIESELKKINTIINDINKELASIEEYQSSIIENLITGRFQVPKQIKSNMEKDRELGMVAEPNTEYHSQN